MKNIIITRKTENLERNLMDQLFSYPFSIKNTYSGSMMKTDIVEYENEYKLFIDLPSVSKDEIEINLEDSYLIVNTKRTFKEEGTIIHRERSFGEYQRSFYVGELVKDSDIDAEFNNGTLIITVKKVVKENNKKTININ